MSQDYRKVLSVIREHSPIHELAERGATPEEVKAALFGVLSPYLSNPEILNNFGLGVLVPDAVVVSRIQRDPWAKQMFQKVLKAHREVANLNAEAAFAAYGDWEPDVQRGLSQWWSGHYLESDKSTLSLEEFVHELSRNMGTVIEASLQPLLRELLHVIRVGCGWICRKDEIALLDLGKVVGELIDKSCFPDLLRPPPWQIPINQWRNMCQHFSLVLRGEQIVGTYGRPGKSHKVYLTRQQLLDAVHKTVLVFNVVKQARTLFILDNLDRIAQYVPDIELRPEHGILCIASAVATQGFELVDFRVEYGSVRATVRDVTDGDPRRRMLHASQFVYLIWCHLERDSIRVTYQDKHGKPWLITIATGRDCQLVSEEQVPFEELAKRVQFIPQG